MGQPGTTVGEDIDKGKDGAECSGRLEGKGSENDEERSEDEDYR